MKAIIRIVVLLLLMLIILSCSACSGESSVGGETQGVPAEKEMDYSGYFKGLQGTAVFYNSKENTYYIYNKKSAEQQSSPCSSFKIVSCLMGLETGVIDPSDSVMKWNGTRYPLDAWNSDIDYKQAFKSSCIWYFRKVIDSVGKDEVQSILDKLDYGNRDISQWEGCLDNKVFPDMNNFRELNGFWQESTLLISPKQQVEVIRRIFEDKGVFSEKNLALMKDVMLIDNGGNGPRVYGKTGSGIRDEAWTDAWFAGMFEIDGETTYFAVRVNQSGSIGKNAKEIAVDIINGEFCS